MKLIRLFGSLLTLCCSLYAVENKQIFTGEILEDGVMKPAFLLEILDTEMLDRLAISENGEVWIKVDKVSVVPTTQNYISIATQTQTMSDITYREEPDIQCNKCKYWYSPQSSNGRRCPKCGKAN
jgi:Zn finger protein HypA/HybF involved in hydrogenase expression